MSPRDDGTAPKTEMLCIKSLAEDNVWPPKLSTPTLAAVTLSMTTHVPTTPDQQIVSPQKDLHKSHFVNQGGLLTMQC